MLDLIYLDNSSTTPVDPEVIDTMVKVMHYRYGNPSSLHDVGMKAEAVIEKARAVMAGQLQCASKNILFTSGGTESNNLAIQGVSHYYRDRGRHLITTQVEHESVYGVYKQLEGQGWDVTYLPVDAVGRIDLTDLKSALSERTVLVSVIHINNEMGTVQPIKEIGRILQDYPHAFFHVDAVQSFGRIPLIPKNAHVDLLTISAHKFYGPKGIGCLYKSDRVHLSPLWMGGGQERGLRPGTSNTPGIAGMAKATLLAEKQREHFLQKCVGWKQLLIHRLTKCIQHIKVNGDITEQGGAPYIVNISFPGLKSEVIVHALEEREIYVGTKSACASRLHVPSRVLTAMGIAREDALGTIRISMGFGTRDHHIQLLIEELEKKIPEYYQLVKVF